MYSPDIADIQTSLRRKRLEKAEDDLAKATEAQKQDEDIMTLARGFTEGGLGSLGLAEGVRKAGETATKTGKLLKSTAQLGRNIVKGVKGAKGTAQDLIDTAKTTASSLQDTAQDTAQSVANILPKAPLPPASASSAVSQSVTDISSSGGNAISDAVDPDVSSPFLPEATQSAIMKAKFKDLPTSQLKRIVRNPEGDRETGMLDTEVQDELNFRRPTFSRPRATATDTPSAEAESLDTSISRARATATDTPSAEASSLVDEGVDVVGDVAGDVAEETGENVVSSALTSAGGFLEGLGSIEDATGILAPLGVATQLGGAVAMVGGLVGGGIGFVKDLENTFKFNNAQDEVKNAQNAPVNVAGRFVLPTSNHANLQALR